MPFLVFGNPSGHDFEFHMNSWMEVLRQWRGGILYPRWAAMAHYGYGEARFIFYPPASWTLGAALGAVLPWRMVPGAYTWIVLTLSGVSMFFLARDWLAEPDATFAAVFYAANPYYLVIVYWRSAFAELLAGALLPFLLMLILRAERDGRRVIVPLSLVVAAAWLTNAPSAVMVNYSIALLAVVVAIQERTPRPLIHVAVAVFGGAALAGFYLLPAAYEEKWVNIAEVLSPGVRPSDNFLFTIINDPEHNLFNLLVSSVASAEMIVLAGTVLFASRWRERAPRLWAALIVWVGAATLLMFSITFIAWDYLPKLRFVQLPWRWLLCLNAAFALLITMATRRWASRLVLCACLLASLAYAWQRLQPPWWDTGLDIAEMQRTSVNPGYEGTDEYVPASADPYEVNRQASKVEVPGDADSQIQVLRWDPEFRIVAARLDRPGNLALRLFNYPAWEVTVNGRALPAQTMEITGQMVIPVSTGENRVEIVFGRTWDRTLGAAISLLASVFLGSLAIYHRRMI
jgi:hypothetical protein